MAIPFRCDGCGRTYKAEEKFVGRTVSCKGCGRSITIQAVADSQPDVYGFDEPVLASSPRSGVAAGASESRAGPISRSKPKAQQESSGFSFMGLKGAAGGAVVVLLIALRVYTTYNRTQQRNQVPAPSAPVAVAATTGVGGQPAAKGAPAPAVWTMPTLPELGSMGEIEPGVSFKEIKLPSPAGPNTMPGHSGKIWIYLPKTRSAPQSLPCVLITAAGSKLFTGMSLGVGDQAEHLPYARAGFAVVAYEMDGFPPEDDNAPDSAYIEPTAAFFRAQAGLINAKVAIHFVITRMSTQIDLNKLYVAGHSSAATAALLVAAHDPRIKGCAAFAPAIDLVAIFPPNVRPTIERLAPGVSELFTRYNPRVVENQINCPLFLFYADDDARFSGQVKEMADRLKGQGKNVTLLAAPSGGHYQSMIEEGIPNAISWFRSLSGGDPWRPITPTPADPGQNNATAPRPGINRPGAPRGGPGGLRGRTPGSTIRRPGMNRPGQ